MIGNSNQIIKAGTLFAAFEALVLPGGDSQCRSRLFLTLAGIFPQLLQTFFKTHTLLLDTTEKSLYNKYD